MDCSWWCFCKHLGLPHTELAACKIKDLGSGNTKFWLWTLCTSSELCFSSLLCHGFSFSSSWDRHASCWGAKLLLKKAFRGTFLVPSSRWKSQARVCASLNPPEKQSQMLQVASCSPCLYERRWLFKSKGFVNSVPWELVVVSLALLWSRR